MGCDKVDCKHAFSSQRVINSLYTLPHELVQATLPGPSNGKSLSLKMAQVCSV